MIMDEYYLGDNIPEIFRIADDVIKNKNNKKKNKKDNKNKKSKDKTDNEYKKNKDKKSEKKESKINVKTPKEYEIEIIQLLARMEYTTRELEKLNPGKRKDAVKIAALNVELRNMKLKLEELENESGIKINELEIGTRFGRFMMKLKSIGRTIKKKAKKFFKHNQELVTGMIAIIAPVISMIILKTVLHI